MVRTPRHCGIGAAALVTLSFAVASCSPRPPDIDHKAFLEAIGFDRLMTVSVELDRLYDARDRFRGDDNAALVSLLAHAGYLRAVPSASAAPWWGYRTDAGTLSGNTFTVTMGTRAVVSRTDVRSWKEGAIQYYAETVTYAVRLTDPLEFVLGAPAKQFALRLVLVNDPAVGAWRVYADPGRGTQFDTHDSATVAQELIARGRAYFNEFTTAIALARQGAYAAIELRLNEEGIVERSPRDPFLIMSRARHLVFYAKPTLLTQPLTEVARYCRSFSVAGYSGFRIPTQPELSAVIDPATGTFFDAPDGRVWGPTGVTSPLASGTVLFVTDTFSANFGSDTFSLDLDTLSGVQPYSYYYNMHSFEIEPSGHSQWAGVVYDVAANLPIGARDWPTARWRVLCVANLKE